MSKQEQVRFTGPLAPHKGSFYDALIAKGYSPLSALNQLRVLAHLSRWLESNKLEPGDLTSDRVDEFLEARRNQGYTCWRSLRGMNEVLEHLRGREVIPAPSQASCSGPLEEFLDSYRAYLVNERGLAQGTVYRYQQVAHQFLSAQSWPDEVQSEVLKSRDVTAFVVRECSRLSTGSATNLISGLRSLMRYLFLEGKTSVDLSSAVPGVAHSRNSSLPKAIEPEQVAAMLGSCDQLTAVGRRDFAVLTMLARMGLRAGEVAALELTDIDWRRGEIIIRGKGRRNEKLPLPFDVGEAVAEYLRHGRPKTSSTKVFMTVRAPYRALSSSGVIAVVRDACQRAGLSPVGAHRLRHTLATELLRSGAPMSEIAQLLRHRSVSTTAIYAKVDRDALRTLAQRWPGGKS